MRLRAFLALLGVPLSAVACTAILGDFTASDGGTGDGGGNDVNMNGDTMASDAPDDTSDAATLFKLTCKETTNTRTQITFGDSLHPVDVRIATIAKNTYRAVIDDYVPNDAGNGSQVVLRAYTITSNGGGDGGPMVDTAELPTTSFQILSMHRYFGPNPGFAAVYIGFDQSLNKSFLYGARIADGSSTWTTVTLAGVPDGLNNTNAEFYLIDPATDHWFVAFTSVTGTSQTLQTAESNNGNPATLQTIQTFTSMQSGQAAFDITKPGIAFLGTNGFIMMAPDTNGPPAAGTGCQLVQGSAITQIKPTSQDIYFPNGFTNASDPMKVNVSFLSADLMNIVGTYYTGQLAASSLGSIDPTTLHGTSPLAADGGTPELKDLFVGGSGNAHWEPVNAIDQFIMVSQTADPISQTLFGGLNFAWWDAPTGQVRAYQAGNGNIIPDVANISNGDATIVTLVGSIAQVEVAYLNASGSPNHGNPPTSADLWLVGLGCIK